MSNPGLRVDAEYYVKVLRTLVAIPTTNPPGQETAAVETVARFLEGLGFTTEYIAAEPHRANLVARLSGRGGGRRLILNGHVDTQPVVDGWTRNPFGGEVEGGKLYGQGVADMKGGVASMVAAAEAIVRARTVLTGELVLMIVADETSGGHKGTGYVVSRIPAPGDLAVVCEPTRSSPIRIAHRGAVWVEVTVTGRGGQGGRPESGINAIQHMARVVTALHEELLPRWRRLTHRWLPPPSLNVGQIAGGAKPNVVPATCRIVLDRRTLPGEEIAVILDDIRRTTERALRESGATVAVREVNRVDPGEIGVESELVRECQRAFHEVTGRRADVAGTAGFTDAHWLIDHWKIPALGFGPWYEAAGEGSITDIPDECIDLDDAIRGTQVYAQLMANVAGAA